MIWLNSLQFHNFSLNDTTFANMLNSSYQGQSTVLVSFVTFFCQFSKHQQQYLFTIQLNGTGRGVKQLPYFLTWPKFLGKINYF